MRQMRKADIHAILGIPESVNDQNQTRELVAQLMTQYNISSFNSFNSRDVFKTALTRELTFPQSRFCPAVLTSYANDAEKCVQALYGLARLIRKSWGPPNNTQAPAVSQPASQSIFAPAASIPTFSLAPTPTPTPTNIIASTSTSAPINMPRTISSTPSMTTAATPDDPTEPSTPEGDAKDWVPDISIYYRNLTNNPFGQALEFRFSDIISIPSIQIAYLLHSTWVDSSALKFIRFANAISEGLVRPIFDLSNVEIWMRVCDPVNKTSYEVTVPKGDCSLDNLEEAYNAILDAAMDNAYNGVLPSEDTPGAYEIMHDIFMGA